MEEKEVFKDQIIREMAKGGVPAAECVIRFGDALEAKEPRTVNILGVIDTPLRWLEKRGGIIDQKQCNIQVSRETMLITLSIGEHDHYVDFINGRLLLSEEYQRFGINKGNYKSGLEMSDLIRMNRTYFAEKKIAMDLVSIMRNFKAKVTNDIENSDDKKGNVSQVRRQAVESNLPPSFELNIPIFKGQPKQKFTVEIDIDPDALQATLVSPDAQDMIVEQRDALIDDVLNSIQEICPEIPIIEI